MNVPLGHKRCQLQNELAIPSMADDSPAPVTGDRNLVKSEPSNPNSKPDLAATPPPLQQSQPQPQLRPQVAAPEASTTPLSQPGPIVPPHAPPQVSGAPVTRLPPPPPSRPGLQFTPVANFQNPSVPNPGVPPPGVSSATVMAVPGSLPQIATYQVPPGQVPNLAALRPLAPMPNGYAGIPGVAPQGTMPPPGVPRYPSPYPAMIRPSFPVRPPGAIGTLPAVPRPPVPGIPGVRPVIPPVVRPAALPSVTPAEKPQTTIYIGKIATVENDFMLSILQFCGPVKHWKRAEDPTTGKPKGFGFYEFESAEGVLRAIRLLSTLNIDGQELLVNVNQATKEYLQRYVEKKMDNAKKAKESQAEAPKDSQAEGSEKEQEKTEGNEKIESAGLSSDELKKDGETKNIDIANSALVTDDEREADREALEKIKNAVEERLKTKPPPPPPPPPAADGLATELAAKSKDGDSDADIARSAEHLNSNETSGEHSRPEASSPDQSGKHDRRSKDRERERDLSREKEQEMERYEREAERERARKEREQRRRLEDAERAYQARLRQWERREREKEKERQYEKEREREKERKRKKEIRFDEDEDEDEDDTRRRWHRGATEEKRRRRLREKEDDLADRLKEEEEVAEVKKAEEEKLQQQQIDALRLLSGQAVSGASDVENKDKTTIQTVNESVHGNQSVGDVVLQNGSGSEATMAVDNASDTQQSGGAAPSKKLGFGLVGSGKRTAVPSVFHEEDEDEAQKEKKMRPLVPIDYSAEEQQAVRHTGSGATPPHLAAAAEFAKRISIANPKEEMLEYEKERSRRSHDKAGHRDKDRADGAGKDKGDHGVGKSKTPDNKKLLDAKQLIDTIPKTKDELFSYEINWAIYDKHQLHERMRPWISKKITEFLGEEESTLVDYIVSNTQEHVKASQMLELLQSILDEEAEMFVLKMWRMLIFEIKRVEAGLPVKSKT